MATFDNRRSRNYSGGSSGLLRYDPNTLQPLPNVTVIRHESVPPRYGNVSSLPRLSREYTRNSYVNDGDYNKNYHIETSKEVIMVPNGGQKHSENLTWKHRLHNNHYIGVHRFTFLLKKFPALVIGIIGVLIFFGRGVSHDENEEFKWNVSKSEKNAAVGAIVTALLTLFGSVIIGIYNHNHSHKSAYFQAVWRLSLTMLVSLLAIATIIFSTLALRDIRLEDTVIDEKSKDCFPKSCFSLNERLAQTGIMLALSIVLVVLGVSTLIFGAVAIMNIEKDRKDVKRLQVRHIPLKAYSSILAPEKLLQTEYYQ